MGDHRVLVTISRNWPSPQAIRDELDRLLAEHGTLVIVHGAAPQGDSIAHNWALSKHHATSYGAVTPEPHPAIWRPGGVYDPAAGFKRNAYMVLLGADECLAWIAPCIKGNCREPRPHGSHGASHTADLAEKAGIPTRRFTDG